MLNLSFQERWKNEGKKIIISYLIQKSNDFYPEGILYEPEGEEPTYIIEPHTISFYAHKGLKMELVEIFKRACCYPITFNGRREGGAKIIEILSNAGIEAKFDNYGNIYAKIEQQNTKSKRTFVVCAYGCCRG